MGVPPPLGLDVLHSCDNPLCVRPDHLFIGTASDNMMDCLRKGRHPRVKLSDAQVVEIRRRFAAGERAKDLARCFGVFWTHIYAIVRGVRRAVPHGH
ncbi:MAG: HNH endonuclease [Vicinamibacteria bacterium]